jgi:hypothetical protein
LVTGKGYAIGEGERQDTGKDIAEQSSAHDEHRDSPSS